MLLTSNPTSEDDIWSRQASTRALVRKVAARKQQELTGEEIFTLADNGDPICQQAVDEFYHILAVGIYNLQYIYDPEIIVIGGGISARADLIDRIREKLDQLLATIPLAKITPAIAACTHQQNANMLGAVYAGTRGGQAPRSSLGLDK
nr:ROK family protein [Gracilibacillus boraciitolerans]